MPYLLPIYLMPESLVYNQLHKSYQQIVFAKLKQFALLILV